MAEVTKYEFSHQELVQALIKQQDLHDGIWSLTVEFGLGVTNAGPDANDIRPTAMVQLGKLGLEKTSDLTNLSADASVVNPVQTKTSSAKSK